MSDIPRQALFGKLNPLAYKSIEGATVFCKLRGNPYVELVHWLTQLLETDQSDVQAIVRHHQLDQAGGLGCDVGRFQRRLLGSCDSRLRCCWSCRFRLLRLGEGWHLQRCEKEAQREGSRHGGRPSVD